MERQKKDLRKLLESIMLCDPVTERGREKLRDLGLLGVIHPKDFFYGDKKMWVEPQFDMPVIANERAGDYVDIYTVSAEEKEQASQNRLLLQQRFIGERGTVLTVVMGVVGNGKSVEMQRLIFDLKHALPYRYSPSGSDNSFDIDITTEAVLVDLEKACLTVPGKDYTYTCPDSNSPLWLFCTKLLATLYNYIKFAKNQAINSLKTIDKTYESVFWKRNVGTSQEKDFFDVLANFYKDENSDIDVLASIESMLTTRNKKTNKWNPREDIKKLLDLMFLVMSCVNTDKDGATEKKSLIILIDNIEDYIITSASQSAFVSNEQVYTIYRLLRDEAEEGINKYDVAGSNFVLPINMAIRRTTWNLLESHHLGNFNALADGLFDVTGNIRIRDIWEVKKKYIWQGYLESSATEEEKKFIKFADSMLCEGDNRTGRPFMTIFSHMMNHGLRRQAHAGSAVIWSIYDLLCGRVGEKDLLSCASTDFMDMQAFVKLLNVRSSEKLNGYLYSPRYLLRHAMVQYYFKNQAIKSGIKGDATGKRWRDLNIGHVMNIADERAEYLFGENGKRGNVGAKEKIKVAYKDSEYPEEPNYRSLLYRILSLLPKELDMEAPACSVPMYKSMHVYDLMRKLFIRPNKTPIFGLNDLTPFKQLASVLLAASRPDREGEYAPFILLRIKFSNGYERGQEGFAALLSRIWKSKPEDREEGGRYSMLRYALRISENGAEFLTNLHAGYDFFAGLYCCNLPPLYFIKSKELITHIIAKVFYSASEVCKKYESETTAFYKGIMDIYEPHGTSYRMRIRELHRNYLHSYYLYIDSYWDTIGIPEEDVPEIKKLIMRYINKYSGQDENGEDIPNRDNPDYKWRCLSPCF